MYSEHCTLYSVQRTVQLSGISKWIKIWLSGTPKWSKIWLSGTPKQSKISNLKKNKIIFFGKFSSPTVFFLTFSNKSQRKLNLWSKYLKFCHPPLNPNWVYPNFVLCILFICLLIKKQSLPEFLRETLVRAKVRDIFYYKNLLLDQIVRWFY